MQDTPTHPADFRATALRATHALLLGSWVGGWLLFGAAVAPAVFSNLPGGEAGKVVGPVLDTLHWYGAAAGLGLALLAAPLGRPRWLAGLALTLGAACLYSQLVVTPAIAAVRDGAFGAQASVEQTERFGQLHRRSMAIFVVVGFGTLMLVLAHARADAQQMGPGIRREPAPHP